MNHFARHLMVCVCLVFVCFFGESSAYGEWMSTYGQGGDDQATSIQQTSDGGYIVAGYTSSSGAGGNDAWILKLNAAGIAVWQKTYGGTSDDQATSIQQTSDGGYIVVGLSYSFSAGWGDIWILKLDSSGNITWQKTYGGGDYDYATSIQQASDGGYIVAGYTYSFGAGGYDIWILKLDSSGNLTWQKTYGGSDSDYAESIQQTSDGGYIVAGRTRPNGGDNSLALILKLDSSGNITWQKTYSNADSDSAASIQQTSDGGYIVAGYTYSSDARLDAWILKLDAAGVVDWQKAYGGTGDEQATSIQQTTDGGYIVAGLTYSFGTGWGDIWILKLDNTGSITWQKTYGGGDYDYATSIKQTLDGGYIVAGYTYSFGAGGNDMLILKVDRVGNLEGCSAIGTSSAIVSNTYVTPVTTAFVPVLSSVVSSNTSATTTNTSVSANVTCSYTPPSQLDTWYLRKTIPQIPDELAIVDDVAYGNGVFVAAGTKDIISGGHEPLVYRSLDGTIWSEVSVTTSGFKDLIFAEGLFVGVCRYDNILTSPDGLIWTIRYAEQDGTGFDGIAYGNGRFVTMGNEVGGTGTSYTSEDGLTWQKHSFQCRHPDNEMMDIAYGNGVFVAVAAYGHVFVSSDGANWTQPDTGLPENWESSVENVVFENGMFIAKTFFFDGRWLTSTDGTHWTIHSDVLPGTNIIPEWFGAEHGLFFSSGFPSGGGSAVELISTNGVNWSPIVFPGEQIRGVTYGKRTFIVTTPYGEIYQSAPDTSPATLTIQKLGTGFGTVMSAPVGISCGSDCSEAFEYGSVITITAQADVDSTFTGWSGACSGTNPECILAIDDDLNVAAIFDSPPQLSTNEGSIGTEITITGSGFGNKKGKVTIRGVALKLAKDGWTNGLITGVVNKVLPPSVPSDVVIYPKEPKGADPITLPGAFTMMAPEITSVDPVSGSNPDEIEIVGNYFGTKKGKVYLEVPGGKPKSCKVTSWGMDSITFVVPKTSKSFPTGTYPLKVTNKVGTTYAPSNFTVD